MSACRNRIIKMVAALGLSALTACSATYRNHGYVPPEEDLQQLVVGVDTRSTVDDVVGPPSVGGVLGDGNYYYVRKKVREYGMFRPEVVERQVLAISFDDTDAIANIERFGLEDGNVVPLSRRVTDSSVVDNGFLRQLLSNIGNINPADAFGG
ncbi:outer membrane protein assembly factor BamE [Roseovarius sp. A21]|uniref:Outer membrane protein assembly factor BamE n=2 Tax=Roseovarius bejariae TaxID=2576383 RepID=A0A844CV22_9RHOB|nr:outer membrane protein assembly factor BamE [Roseovarius bejariae]